MFAGVIFFTCLTQWALVQYGGEFTRTAPLTAMEWAETVLLGSLSVPVGVLMRCLPPFEENPANFASTPLLAADDSRRARERGRKPEAVLPALFAAFVPTAAYILFRFYKLNPDIASEVIDNFKGSTGASEL
mmetsp:Transcript_2684/g.4535  ORF Transcript_2684/g.4535 Transcript_2684/m.4535 type:complete len:132 (+) Transcript_2684:2-397(+)